MSSGLSSWICLVPHRKKASLFFAFLFLFLYAIGCASGPPVTTHYNDSEDITRYETSVSLQGLSLGGGYGSGANVRIRALASCPGAECEPEEVALVFQVSGNTSLRMENRTVELQVNGQEFRSSEGQEEIARTIHGVDQVSGDIAGIKLSFEEFRKVATAEEVAGKLGSSTFSLSHENRNRFRALVRRTQQEPSEEASS